MAFFFGELGEVGQKENDFLTDTPLELKQMSIKRQFDNLGDSMKVDYVKSYIDQFEATRDNIHTDDEQIELDQLQSDFVSFMLDLFQKKLGVGFDIEDKPDDEQNEILHMTYRFFIRYCRKNFINVAHSYLFDDDNKDELQELFATTGQENVIGRDYRREINDPYDVMILSNLTSAIAYALRQEYTIDEFLSACEGDEACSEIEFMRENMDDFTITGNFIPSYIALITDDLLEQIETRLRRKILHRHRQK